MGTIEGFAKALSQLELKQLRQLAAVAEKKSIRAAAKDLAIAQPALSRSIRNLEEALGIQVVERGPRGVEITKYGDALLKYGRIIDANLRFAADELETLRQRPAGSVRMGLGSLEGSSIGSIAITRLIKRRPNVEISVIDGNSSVLLPRLLSGEIDFMFGPAPLEGIAESVSGEILASMRSVIVVRASHPLARRQRIQFGTVAAADWILPNRGSAAYQRFANMFSRHGFGLPHWVVEAPSVSLTLVGLILNHDLVGILPLELIKHYVSAGEMKILPLDGGELDIPIYLARRDFGQLPPAARDLIAELRHACKEIKSASGRSRQG